MGYSHLSTFIYIAVIPGAITGLALGYIGDRFELTSLQRLIAAVPLWLAILSGWVFGMAGLAYLFGVALALIYPMPRCACCGQPLLCRHAEQCFHCGADWHKT
ncbi:hypothetical protein [Allorhodopirellula solitaria]|uniref:Uncharacterized protein n=1 Tax=Allorhodopirellula solitaria TaxID=2527987 RepID=A0A5C5YD30_9BACT|nr:hypothetical protein [Allorhodopirellula solitaria]TWT72994.1 hypothetical protein CA85_14550 [Allorhodopirellula solitaria]